MLTLENNYFKSFEEFQDYADYLYENHAINQKPDRFLSMLDKLNIKINIPAVQVIGTKGKGSTSTFVSSLGIYHGLKVGLLTTPKFLYSNESIKINNKNINKDKLLDKANEIKHTIDYVMKTQGISFLEYITVLAIKCFVDEQVDLMVLETGCGGITDSVSALPVNIIGFTTIDIDHTSLLGNTLEEIANSKGDVIRNNVPVISIDQQDIVNKILLANAKNRNSPFMICGGKEVLPELQLTLKGEFQYKNAALALALWRQIANEQRWIIDEQKEIEGLSNAFIPGRFQFIDKIPEYNIPVICNNSTNAFVYKELKKELDLLGIVPSAVITNFTKGRDYTELVNLILDITDGPIYCLYCKDHHKQLDSEEELKLFGSRGILAYSLEEIFEKYSNQNISPIMVMGSIRELKEFYTMYPQYLEGNE